MCFPSQTQLEQIAEEQVGLMEEEMPWAPWMDPRAPTPVPLLQAGLRAPLLGRHLPVCSFAFRRAAEMCSYPSWLLQTWKSISTT